MTKHQSQTLFNIQTGKAASIEVKTSLLGIRHTGEEHHKTFVRECLALKSPSFKRELPTFLLNEWKEQAYVHIIHERHMYVGHLDECRHFYVEDGVVRHDTIDVLGCNHAEAETRICLHARGIDYVGNANNIIIRASDIDIAVIMIQQAWKFSATLWMNTGTSNDINRRYVNLSAIAISIGSNVARPCRPTMRSRGQITRQRSFERKGQAVRRLESSNDAQDALIAITSGKVDASSERALRKFGATLFGAKAAESSPLNRFRYTAFEKAFGPSANAKNPLNKLKGVDASSLPPCEAELRQHYTSVCMRGEDMGRCRSADHRSTPSN